MTELRKPISKTQNIDCMEYMSKFPDKFFDLAVVDPPYGINKRGKVLSTNYKRLRYSQCSIEEKKLILCKWDYNPPGEDYFAELFRVSKNQIIWGGNYFNLPPSRCIVVWDKKQALDNFSKVELAWTSFDYPAKLISFGNFQHKDKGIHPTQKPVALYSYLLKNFAKDGDKILDTHLGSGSSRIAAYFAGLDFWGCELDAEYYAKEEEHFRERCLNINYYNGHEIIQQTLF